MFCLLQLPNTNQEAACNPKQDLDYKKVVQSRIAEMSILAFCKILGLEPKLVYQRFELRRVKHSVKYVAVAASSFHTWSLSHRLAGVEVYIYYKRIYIYISLIIQYVDTEKCLAEVHFIGQPCWQAPSVSEGDKNTIIGGTYLGNTNGAGMGKIHELMESQLMCI